MADEILKRDQNHVTVLAGVTDNAAQDVTMLRIDPTTKRLLVSATGLPGDGTVTSISQGTGITLTPNPIIATGTVALANTAVTPGSYTLANITVDQQGRITAAANGSGGGSGTVTSVSVVTNQGVSGSVANPTTTPAITLTLGALTDVTSLNGLVITANTGVITTGTWNGTTIAVANGGTGITSFGAGVATWLGTPSSANLAAAVTGETGTGGLVFADTPTLITPVLGVATATSINGLTISTTTGTLTLANGSTLVTSGANSITLTSTGATNVTLPTTGTLATLAGVETLSNKTLTAPKFVNGGFIADANGNEEIIFTTTASAVNEITIANAATGNDPLISATGGDTNVSLKIHAKGTGKLKLGTDDLQWPNADGSANQAIITNGSGVLSFSSIALAKFGGDGADGALTLTSGATNIDLAGAQLLVKNYTSISITGTGSLTFTNPHANGTTIVLKSQGNVTLTSSATPMIDVSALGAIGGDRVTSATDSDGLDGTNGIGFSYFQTNFGGKGLTGLNNSTGGAVPTLVSPSVLNFNVSLLAQKYPHAFVGAGGGSGSCSNLVSGTSTTGRGGRGGGCLIIECGGAWNFTTTSGISVAGEDGEDAVSLGTAPNAIVTGGGGGGGGFFLGIYNSLTANTGTVTVSGGAESNDITSGSGSEVSNGAGGGSATNAGTGSAYSTSPTGGVGGDGLSLVSLNTDFA